MSGSKCSAPVKCAPAGGGGSGKFIGTLVTLPLIVAGLAAVGVAKGAQKGYHFVKKTRAETSESEIKHWLAEMKRSPLERLGVDGKPSMTGDGLNLDKGLRQDMGTGEQIFNLEVKGIKLDNVFKRLHEMDTKNNESGLWVNDYTVDQSNERVIVVGLDGSDNRLAFTKDKKGKYQAVGTASSEKELSKDVNRITTTFYRNTLYYQLYEWGLKDIKIKDSSGSSVLTSKDSPLKVEINRQNGQVSFQNIPVHLREKVRKWLETFTECRVIDSGGPATVKSGRKRKGGAVTV